jgi:hypothetical protein
MKRIGLVRSAKGVIMRSTISTACLSPDTLVRYAFSFPRQAGPLDFACSHVHFPPCSLPPRMYWVQAWRLCCARRGGHRGSFLAVRLRKHGAAMRSSARCASARSRRRRAHPHNGLPLSARIQIPVGVNHSRCLRCAITNPVFKLPIGTRTNAMQLSFRRMTKASMKGMQSHGLHNATHSVPFRMHHVASICACHIQVLLPQLTHLPR